MWFEMISSFIKFDLDLVGSGAQGSSSSPPPSARLTSNPPFLLPPSQDIKTAKDFLRNKGVDVE